jgi:hypothetical protein
MTDKRLHKVSVTYSLVTEESVVDGDHADHGYIQPGTEARRSFANGRKRDIERNVRMARADKFEFATLREALAFISRQNCASHETCWDGSERTMGIYCTDAYQGCDVENFRGSPVLSVGYDLHIQGCSYGTLDRLARVLMTNGVYFANCRRVQRSA